MDSNASPRAVRVHGEVIVLHCWACGTVHCVDGVFRESLGRSARRQRLFCGWQLTCSLSGITVTLKSQLTTPPVAGSMPATSSSEARTCRRAFRVHCVETLEMRRHASLSTCRWDSHWGLSVTGPIQPFPPSGGLFYIRNMFKALPSAVHSIGSLNDLTCPHADTDRVETDWPNSFLVPGKSHQSDNRCSIGIQLASRMGRESRTRRPEAKQCFAQKCCGWQMVRL